ncbi:hypothetical protein HKX48_005996 [Thoreauomyces humboldtii]|nr:hypothetical protein HKX48_005996 [Thoreauomyces humboldtii]
MCLPSDIPPECVAPITRTRVLMQQASRGEAVWNWHNAVARARLFRSLFEDRYTITGDEKDSCLRFLKPTQSPSVDQVDAVLSAIEANMYPFIAAKPESRFASAQSLLRSYAGRGIVMTTGNEHTRFAVNTIRMLRDLGCTLPIQIFYADDDDLHVRNRAVLGALPDVELVDLSTLLDIHAASQNGEPITRLGWAMKPFAMLASRFREVILIDADLLFLQKPEVMLDYPLYKDTGVLLFRDRTLGAGSPTLSALMEELMEGLPMSAYYHKEGRAGRWLSGHEGESGVIVFDKHRNFHSLLMACKMNSGPYQRDLYSIIHGDKETYWMAQEMLDLPYSWAPGAGGSIGYLEPHPHDRDMVKICGQLYHPDPDLQPLWANGGMVSNKRSPKGEGILEFTHWGNDMTFRNVTWDWEMEDKPFCLHLKKSARGEDWDSLGPRELNLIDKAVKDWKEIIHFDGGKDKAKKAVGKVPTESPSAPIEKPFLAARLPPSPPEKKEVAEYADGHLPESPAGIRLGKGAFDKDSS